jgi:hypothetical protein
LTSDVAEFRRRRGLVPQSMAGITLFAGGDR